MASGYRKEFLEALNLLAAACDEVERAGYGRPVLVGGAAVEFYTLSAITSGDFDLVTAAQQELEQALLKRGFERPMAQGQLLRGLIHRDLSIGVEVVSGELFDGACDKSKLRLLKLGGGTICLPAVEDMIANRLGQYADGSL